MTEEDYYTKRFKYIEFTKNTLSFDDNGVCKFFNEKDFEDWLNELHKENERLKEEKYAYLGEITLYEGESTKRKKENEQLKQENEELKRENECLQQKIEDLSYENIEMLKNTIARNEAYIRRMQHKGDWRK